MMRRDGGEVLVSLIDLGAAGIRMREAVIASLVPF
jgi:hypothetical protein